MSPSPRLVLQSDRSKVAPLDPGTPLTIGRSANNRLSLPREAAVSEHHAVVRYSAEQGWLICDWNSASGTFLNGLKVGHCRPLADGAAIQLGEGGPVLLFERGPASVQAAAPAQGAAAAPTSVSTPAPGSTPAPVSQSTPQARGASSAAGGQSAPASRPDRPPMRPATQEERAPGPSSLDFAGERLALDQILSVTVRSEPRHPHIFSWWLLLCLTSLLLLPFPLLFWILEISGLAGWIVLGSRKEHRLVVVLRNGLAYRRSFANRPTALSHRNGIRKALGQSPDD